MKLFTKFYRAGCEQASATLAAHAATFAYEPKQPVVRELTMKVPQSGVYRISGAVGSGVSTVLKLLSGILAPQQGEVTWGALRVDSEQMSRDAHWRLSVAYVPRSGGLLANQDLISNSVLPLVYHGWLDARAAREQLEAYLQGSGMEEEFKRLPAWTSLRARKAALLLRALLPQPQLLIVDEPMEGLNADSSDWLLKLVQEHRAQAGLRLVLMGSQDASWDKVLGATEIKLDRGRVVETA